MLQTAFFCILLARSAFHVFASDFGYVVFVLAWKIYYPRDQL